MPDLRLTFLFDKYINGTCTPVEKKELAILALASQHDADVQDLLQQYWNQVTAELKMPNEKATAMVADILKQSLAVEPGKVKKMSWVKWVAAASILLITGVGAYMLFLPKPGKQSEVVNTTLPNEVKPPETNRAMITLANGKKLYLDSVANGTTVTQNNVALVKLADGQIAYRETGDVKSEIVYNTLTNPRGSKVIDMTLADGSHVWLNAGSSVTYPVVFVGAERKVSVTGEAYFEIAKAPSNSPVGGEKGKMPFIVKIISRAGEDKGEVTVLGTHFNVNAYDDEEEVKVTLLEGSVKVNSEARSQNSASRIQNSEVILKPGQQAVLTQNLPAGRQGSAPAYRTGRLKTQNNVDLEQVMAWKNGRFLFNKTDIQTTMRQIARWYDVDIEYSGNVKGFFSGSINRSENISQVLKLLELTDEAHFTIEGRKIMVKP